MSEYIVTETVGPAVDSAAARVDDVPSDQCQCGSKVHVSCIVTKIVGPAGGDAAAIILDVQARAHSVSFSYPLEGTTS